MTIGSIIAIVEGGGLAIIVGLWLTMRKK